MEYMDNFIPEGTVHDVASCHAKELIHSMLFVLFFICNNQFGGVSSQVSSLRGHEYKGPWGRINAIQQKGIAILHDLTR